LDDAARAEEGNTRLSRLRATPRRMAFAASAIKNCVNDLGNVPQGLPRIARHFNTRVAVPKSHKSRKGRLKKQLGQGCAPVRPSLRDLAERRRKVPGIEMPGYFHEPLRGKQPVPISEDADKNKRTHTFGPLIRQGTLNPPASRPSSRWLSEVVRSGNPPWPRWRRW